MKFLFQFFIAKEDMVDMTDSTLVQIITDMVHMLDMVDKVLNSSCIQDFKTNQYINWRIKYLNL